MRSLAWAVGLTLVGSLGGVLVASALLSFNDRIRLTIVPWLVSYAVGTLLGVALLVLLPEALAHLSARTVLASLLGGIMLFFLLEKLVLWRHCHTHDCEAHGMAAPMVIIGDAFHNFLDGVVIGTAVRTSIPLGVSTALAVAAHEIPQELGDVAILLNAGYTRRKALILNLALRRSSRARRRACRVRAGVASRDQSVRALGRRRRISVRRDGRPHSRISIAAESTRKRFVSSRSPPPASAASSR